MKAFCCISGTIHLCTSDIMDRSMIYDIRVLQDTLWYQKNSTLKIFLFSNFITSYQQTMTFTSGLFVVESFWQCVLTIRANSEHECTRTNSYELIRVSVRAPLCRDSKRTVNANSLKQNIIVIIKICSWLPPFCNPNVFLFIQPRWQLRRTYFFNRYNVLF